MGGELEFARDGVSDRSFADAGPAVEDERGEFLVFHHSSDDAVLTDKMGLSDDVIQGCGAHSVSQWFHNFTFVSLFYHKRLHL